MANGRRKYNLVQYSIKLYYFSHKEVKKSWSKPLPFLSLIIPQWAISALSSSNKILPCMDTAVVGGGYRHSDERNEYLAQLF
jgi:hypothetical protein